MDYKLQPFGNEASIYCYNELVHSKLEHLAQNVHLSYSVITRPLRYPQLTPNTILPSGKKLPSVYVLFLQSVRSFLSVSRLLVPSSRLFLRYGQFQIQAPIACTADELPHEKQIYKIKRR